MDKTLIEFTLIWRKPRSRRILKRAPCWVATCSFDAGPGMKVKKMTTTRDITKAARWSLAAAKEIAAQFSHLPAKLVTPDGTVLAEETTALQAEQLRRHATLQALKRELDDEFNRVFAPAWDIIREGAHG